MKRGRIALVLLAILSSVVFTSRTAKAQEFTCFQETGLCISGRFREYWHQQGGLAVFGFPITEELTYVDPQTRVTTIYQWFERNIFELHPENRAPYDVLLGRLGDAHLILRGIDWQTLPPESGAQSGCLWFEQTGHNVCDQTAAAGFKRYWESHGLEFDGQQGKSYAESLALFGLPLTSPRMETNDSGDTVLTQWFERARFEFHPSKPVESQILLGLLGTEYPEDEEEPAPTPSPEPADQCANIAPPQDAYIEPNCVRYGDDIVIGIYGIDPFMDVSYWVTKSTGETVGGIQSIRMDSEGAFEANLSTVGWELYPGDYVFVAQDIQNKYRPSTAPFRVLP